MEEERRGRRGLTRRQVLIGGGVLGAAALGITTHGVAVLRRRTDRLVLAPVRRRRRRAPDGDPGRHRFRARGQRRARADPAVGQPLLHEARAGRRRRIAARTSPSCTRRGCPRFAPAGLLEELTPEMLARHGLQGDRLPRAAVEERPVGRQAVRDPARHPPVRPLLQHRALREGGAAQGRQAARARRTRRAARRLRGDQGRDRQDRARVRDARRDAVADLPHALQPARRPADPRRRRHQDRHGRRHRDQGAPVDGGAAQARRRRARRRLPGLGGVLRQRDRRLRAQRRVGGHHLPGPEDEVRHADGADDLRHARPTRPTRTRS